MSYSVAIRTLGVSPVFRQELESLHQQTVKPERIMIYIAEGYPRPQFTVGEEEYKWVPKGMVRQRALSYDEIKSDYILLLDDDVVLAPNTVELLLKAAKQYSVDCIAPDTFRNHQMSLKTKFYAAITNMVFPRPNDKWAFLRHRNGSFSYNNNPNSGFYWSQTCDGPAWLCKRDVLLSLHLEDELWLDKLGFSYGDDSLESYKLFKNGYKLGVYYGDQVKNLNAKTSSGDYHKNTRKFYVRSYASFVLWWRMIYDIKEDSALNRLFSCIFFGIKAIWLLPVNCIAAFFYRDIKIPYYYTKGIIDGWNFVHSEEYKKIPSYILKYRN